MFNKEQNKVKNIFLVLFLIILIIVSWLIYKSNIPLSTSYVSPVIDKSVEKEAIDPFFESRYVAIPSTYYPKSGYSISILSKSNLLVFWTNQETFNQLDNTKILQARFENKAWSQPQAILSTSKLSTFNQKYIRDIYSHAVYQDNNGIIHLFSTSNNIINFSGNNINHLISQDDGKNWILAGKSMSSLLFSKNQLIHQNIENLVDGFYLPIKSQFLFKYIPNYYEKSQLLRFSKNGNFIEPIPLSQMKDNKLYVLPFDNHSVRIFQLDDNSIFMIYNIDDNKSKLGIAKLMNGHHWNNIKILEDKEGDIFTDPVIQIKNGSINLLYTWNYKYIKHLRFNKEWLIDRNIDVF